jgi:hypothetical protein
MGNGGVLLVNPIDKIGDRTNALYLNHGDRVAYPKSLLKGNDLIQTFNIKSSPLIDKLLTEIQVAQIENKINFT